MSKVKQLVTARGRRALAIRFLACFGLLSAAIQLYSAIFVPSSALPHPVLFLVGVAAISSVWAIARTIPRSSVSREFKNPEMTITVKVGDLFAESGQIMVGFSDTFDTDIAKNEIISANSLQGQLLVRQFGSDAARLDAVLEPALAGQEPVENLVVGEKRGKRARYPIGTVATFDDDAGHRIYGLAYTRMGTNLVVESSIHDLWYSLGQLWDAVFERGQHEPIAVPLIGTRLARIQCVDRESLLRIILLSFVARSREQKLCSEFTVVIHESDWSKMNTLEIEAFLATL